MSQAPSWLSTIGKAYWRALSSLVDTQDKAQHSQLAMLCDHLATYRQAAEQLTREGLTVQTLSGAVKAHPAVTIKHAASDQVQKLCRLMGLQASKEKLVTVVDELDELLED